MQPTFSLVCAAAMSLALAWSATAQDAPTAQLRTQRYTSRSPEEARQWQESLRGEFFRLLKMDDLRAGEASLPLEPEVVSSVDKGAYTLREVSIRTTPGRRMTVALATPDEVSGPRPAVVALHGHGGKQMSAFDKSTGPNDRIYKEFGARLAESGYVVVAPSVGQHEVYEDGRTLMGERLWDCMRAVDYLRSLPEVDDARVGCAGLSLGGEMALWLGAMDTRVSAVVSAGFLTVMDQMEKNHCLCWKFDGLRERVDWPDVYAMIAPRPLQCQNGLREPENDFTVPLAEEAMAQVKVAYRDMGKPDNARLHVHEGAHEVDLPALMSFLDEHLK